MTEKYLNLNWKVKKYNYLVNVDAPQIDSQLKCSTNFIEK